MRILDRYIVREIFRHAFLGLVVFTFVLFVPQLVRLMELLVRHSGSSGQIGKLFLFVFPGVLIFTIPMAVLTGVLLGLGRMSADSEIIALTALGVSRQRMLVPVGVLALTGALLTGTLTLWLGPAAFRGLRGIEADLLASQASFQVQPRVFDERFPKTVLYVNDISASGTHWHGVFLAEAGQESGASLTLAEDAIVIAEAKQGKLELHMRGGATHEVSRQDPDHYSVTDFGQSDLPIEVSGLVSVQERKLSNAERRTGDLLWDNSASWREARVEFQRRLAFPAACLVFALVAVPLGSQPRRGGRAAGTLLSVLLIAAYYSLSVMGAGMARSGKLSPWLGIWLANIVLTVLAIILLPRMEQMRGDRPWLRRFSRFEIWRRLLRRRKTQAKLRAAEQARAHNGNGGAAPSDGSFPRLLDLYLLRRFFAYFALLMLSFVFLFHVFTFFELLDDIARHRVPFLVVVNYFRYLTPYLLYQLSPLGALVAVLVTLGVMSKNNEIVACKASGISLYRLALPLLAAGMALAFTMILMDDLYLPYTNQRQDALRNQIKGRPAQTYTRPQRWIFGENGKIYNYDLFEPAKNLFAGLTVVELEPETFRVRRRVFANQAHWSDSQNAWVLESGWVRDFQDGRISSYQKFSATALPELSEPPSYFNREVRQASQLSFRQLGSYIEELRRAGFDVSALSVQWYVKIAFPLIAPVSMLLAIPYAFSVGGRGAIGGIAVGLAVGIGYWLLSRLLEAMGGVGQMPPPFAAFAPDLVFYFLGMYFFFKMPT
ncbi:MAG TPA: LPS export ABC transporter permease LptF [Dongiaceae bacterium]|nr:LPS export ABC transporter permease LptF [Dongiaceae bacterium]